MQFQNNQFQEKFMNINYFSHSPQKGDEKEVEGLRYKPMTSQGQRVKVISNNLNHLGIYSPSRNDEVQRHQTLEKPKKEESKEDDDDLLSSIHSIALNGDDDD